MNKCLKNIQRLIYAPRCSLCQSPEVDDLCLCAQCNLLLPWRTHYCRTCGVPLVTGSVDRCGRCLARPFHFDRLLAPFWYESPIKDWLTAYKFHAQWHYGGLCADLFLQALQSNPDLLVECLIPVPMHSKRLRLRGFNQANDWAQLLRRELNLPILTDAVKRVRLTPPQTSLNAKARTTNLKNAFRLDTKWVDTLSQFRSVAIVDDVVTTGSTVDEVAKLLKRLGIEKVVVWAVARAR